MLRAVSKTEGKRRREVKEKFKVAAKRGDGTEPRNKRKQKSIFFK